MTREKLRQPQLGRACAVVFLMIAASTRLLIAPLATSATAQAIGEPLALQEPRSAQEGEWQSNGLLRASARSMVIEIEQRVGEKVTGRVTLRGSSLLQEGRIEGMIRGGLVTGSVRDEQGEIAARFVGRVNADGTMSGTYTDRTGETGTWQWPVAGRAIVPGR